MAINDRCTLRTEGGHRVVIVCGGAMWPHRVGDRVAEAYAMAGLVEGGWASQVAVARAFGCASRTVRRHQERLNSGGLGALGRPRGYPQGRARLVASRLDELERLKREGMPNREIGRRLAITETAVRKLLRRRGWKAPKSEQQALAFGSEGADPKLSASPASPHDVVGNGLAEGANPKLSGSANEPPPGPSVVAPRATSEPPAPGIEPLPVSFDPDPADRSVDRLLAYLGLLDDAAPLFRSGARVPMAGVLLAVPALVQGGVLDVARQVYGSIGPAFYGLRTTLLTMLLMALLRIKRPEGLKEVSPEDFGRVLGLDRAPEVKTLRRKLGRLADVGRAATFGRELAVRRVADRGAAMGFLYVDGHVRVYHGERTLPKAHVARMRISLPATTDYWVNDQAGDPLLIVTAPANAGLVRMMPGLLTEVRSVVGERRVTVVFDRGGYSPELFRKLVADHFDILTYNKGRCDPLPESCFSRHEAVIDGRKVAYDLADRHVSLLRGRLTLRLVTRRTDDGHQTPILTSREDLPAVEVAWRMFERWRQENFFKYLRDEYALDALVDYRAEADDPERDVPNPARKAIDSQLRDARAELSRLLATYGDKAISNPESRRRTMRGFKIAHGKIGKAARAAMKRVADLEAARARVPHRVPVQTVVPGQVVKLANERKLLTSLLKMVAYQAESDLVRLVAPHYSRVDDEGRTLIQSALGSPADIAVRDGELRVCLAPLSSPHRSRALAALCNEVNRSTTTFPGTRLRLRFEVADAPPATAEPDRS
ncbi:MAG: helix-turn-helix domain-containing protein [Deltaproteobacteria bacterium]|nr:helix-turn-helix domain-containing protein [Deltaproteobacteria bacterium]